MLILSPTAYLAPNSPHRAALRLPRVSRSLCTMVLAALVIAALITLLASIIREYTVNAQRWQQAFMANARPPVPAITSAPDSAMPGAGLPPPQALATNGPHAKRLPAVASMPAPAPQRARTEPEAAKPSAVRKRPSIPAGAGGARAEGSARALPRRYAPVWHVDDDLGASRRLARDSVAGQAQSGHHGGKRTGKKRAEPSARRTTQRSGNAPGKRSGNTTDQRGAKHNSKHSGNDLGKRVIPGRR